MREFGIKPLSGETWAEYADLVSRHGGVWGGCWCMAFHPEGFGKIGSAEGNRAAKEARVRSGQAHAALVYAGADCVGWCQFGPVDELPRIKHRRAYEAGEVGEPARIPDWRITCFFVDKAWRGKGVAAAALAGAVGLIAGAGGGLVESFPEDAAGRVTASAFLHNGEVGMFDRLGFARIRKLGKHRWLVGMAIDQGA